MSSLPTPTSVVVLSPSIPASSVKLRLQGWNGPQLNQLRHALFKAPSVCIIDCTIFANDTTISDQVLSHQLTLVPIRLDPAFALAAHDRRRTVPDTSANTLVFTVTVDCPPTAFGEPDTEVHVFARDLRFHPVGDQLNWSTTPADSHQSRTLTPVTVLNPDMRLMTLRSRGRNSFHAEIKASIGTADEHSKFSDVLHCWFRPVPHIRLTRPIRGAEAKLLVHLCKKAVFSMSAPTTDAANDGTADNDDALADAKDRTETDAYWGAYTNERAYSMMHTMVPVMKGNLLGGASDEAEAELTGIRVVQPDNCDMCGACQSAALTDVEDLTKPSIPSAIELLLSPTTFLFFLRARPKSSAVDMLLGVLDSLHTDRHFTQLATQLRKALRT